MCNSLVVYLFFKSTEGTRKVCSALILLNLLESMPSLPLGGEKLKSVSTFYFKGPFPFRWWTGKLSNAWQVWERIPVTRASNHFLRCVIFQMLWAALSFHRNLSTEPLPNIKAMVLRVLCLSRSSHATSFGLLPDPKPFYIFPHLVKNPIPHNSHGK